VYRSSASGIDLAYQAFQRPALSPATSTIAWRSRVEHEEQAHLGSSWNPWPQFLEIVDLAAVDAIDKRPPELRTTLREFIERLLDFVGRSRIVLA
jgi:hypothetical protein